MRHHALKLRLYIAGAAPHSVLALRRLKELLQQVNHPYELEVVDVFQMPERALADQVLVTPTLVRLAPTPEVRIVGNLSESATVLEALLPQQVGA